MSLTSNDTTTKLVQVFALGMSAYLGGLTYSMTHLSLPILLPPHATPAQAALQWRALYDVGIWTSPPLSILSAASFGWLSWAHGGLATRQGAAYALAAVLGGSHAPWTLATMLPTNDALMRIAKESEEEPEATGPAGAGTEKQKEKDAETVRLLKWWGTLNALRSVGATVAAVVGLAAAVGLIG